MVADGEGVGKMEENNGTKTEPTELELISVLGFSGGSIHSFKKTKAIFAYLAHQYGLLKGYKWDKDFFGPYSDELVKDLYKLYEELWLAVYQKHKDNTVHHSYELSRLGEIRFKNAFDSMKELLEKNKIELKKFLPECIAWNSLPCSYVTNEVIRQNKSGYTSSDIERPSTVFWWTGVEYTENILKKMIEIYEKDKGIHLEKTGTQNGKIFYKMRVDEGVTSERYNDLKPDDAPPEEDLKMKDLAKFSMKKLKISNKEVETEIENIRMDFEKNKKIYQESFRMYMNKLENFWKTSNNCTEGTTVSFDKYGHVSVTIHPDLKGILSDWNEGYLNHVFHLLRPETIL